MSKIWFALSSNSHINAILLILSVLPTVRAFHTSDFSFILSSDSLLFHASACFILEINSVDVAYYEDVYIHNIIHKL